MNLTRRNFVKAVAIAPATVAASLNINAATAAASPNAQNPLALASTHWDCVVCGGGMAGVTAAARLQRRGYRVLLLEANQRLGGRIYTIRDAERFGSALELGAEYIHRTKGSVPLWEEIDREKLHTIAVEKDVNTLIHDPEFDRVERLSEHTRHLSLGLKARFAPLAFGVKYHSDVESFLGGLNDENEAMARMAFSGHLPASAELIDYRSYIQDGIFEQLSAPYDYRVVNGLDSIINAQVRSTPVLLGHPVQSIHRHANGVTITALNQQTKETITFKAKAAVCTFSINMLKSEAVKFSPELPENRRHALQQVGMGDIAKVVIRFRKPFFPDDMGILIWPDRKGPRRGSRTWFREYFGDKNSAPVLTAFLMGPDADRLRQMDDEKLLTWLCQDLDHMFPESKVPAFKNIAKATIDGREQLCFKRYHWLNDPFAKGGYSYIKAGSEPFEPWTVRERLANPNDTLPIFWAGEAYSLRTQPGSMHGAHLSGVDAAIMVDQYLKQHRRKIIHPRDIKKRGLASGPRAIMKGKINRNVYQTWY